MSATKQEGELGEVYAAETSRELAEVYDRWSNEYDRYMNEGGYRHPAVCAGLIARYISDIHAPILDAGVGTGLVGDLLGLLGYKNLTGIDISNSMLKVAHNKRIYRELKNADLLSYVSLPKIHYAAAVAAGIFTKNSAKSLRMTKAIKAGIIWVNTYRAVSPIAQFGGFKQSGFGRESGFQAIYDYTRPKTVWINTSDDPIDNPFIMR